MPYKFLGHTADVKMMVWGESLEKLFVDAFYGLMDYLTPENPNFSGQAKRLISVSGPDFTALLIDFLNESLALAQIHKEIYRQIKFNHFPSLEDKNLIIEAEIIGQEVDEFKEDIKAITYHEAQIVKAKENEWSVSLIFDI